MEIKQIQYILEIAEEGSIAKAAEKMFLTQSTLNQQLLRLERELGVALFSRTNRSMVPTYAGTVYLEAARKMLDIRNDTYKFLHDISNIKRGEISLAVTPEQGARMFSDIYPQFHGIYPDITFKIHEARVKKMEMLLEKKTVDIAFLARTEKKNPLFDYRDMYTELMVIGLPASHPLAHLAGEESWRTFPSLDINLLKDEDFVLMTQETLMRDMIDELFEAGGIKPRVLFESTSTSIVVQMVKKQLCAAFFPQSYVDPQAPVVYFSTSPPITWTLSAAIRKGTYLNKAELDFIQLSREYYLHRGFSAPPTPIGQ